MYRRWQLWLGIPALALAALLFTTNRASAQRFGRGMGGGWNNGGNWNHGNLYFPNNAFGSGYYGNGFYGNGYYGNGYYGNGYGNWYGRGYYGNNYSPWNNGYYNNNSSNGYYADYDQQPNYSSFYPQEDMPQNAAMVHVRVPNDAELWFGGDKTTQSGSQRDFVTPELKQDKDYFYTLKARWTGDDGQQVERTRRVKVHAGGHVMVDFLRNDPNANPPVRTNAPPVERTPAPAERTPIKPAPRNNNTNPVP